MRSRHCSADTGSTPDTSELHFSAETSAFHHIRGALNQRWMGAPFQLRRTIWESSTAFSPGLGKHTEVPLIPHPKGHISTSLVPEVKAPSLNLRIAIYRTSDVNKYWEQTADSKWGIYRKFNEVLNIHYRPSHFNSCVFVTVYSNMKWFMLFLSFILFPHSRYNLQMYSTCFGCFG